MNTHELRGNWRLLMRVWETNGHCLKLGCGRDTLQCWVHITTGEWVRPSRLRRVLMEGVRRGWATKSQSNSGHSIFILKD